MVKLKGYGEEGSNSWRDKPIKNYSIKVEPETADKVFSKVARRHISKSAVKSKYQIVNELKVGETIRSQCTDKDHIRHGSKVIRCKTRLAWQAVQSGTGFVVKKSHRGEWADEYDNLLQITTACYRGWVYVRLERRNPEAYGYCIDPDNLDNISHAACAMGGDCDDTLKVTYQNKKFDETFTFVEHPENADIEIFPELYDKSGGLMDDCGVDGKSYGK